MRLPEISVPVAVCAALAIGAWASPQTSTHPQTAGAKKKTTTTTAKAKSTVAPTARSKRVPVVAHRAPQQPSQERYKEIQQALAAKGYFNTEPDGNWGPASIEALRRFQRDQNLVEDGKIGSLSLIALGLGPKRDEPEQKTP